MPPHFAKLKPQVSTPFSPNTHSSLNEDDEPQIPEDVYDIPPAILTDKLYHGDRGRVGQTSQEIYDIPASLRSGSHPPQDLYDFPREREEKEGDRRDLYVYDVPPQVGQLQRSVWTF